jgi:hypothetical protein
MTLPDVKLYEASNDASLLSLDQVHIYSDFANSGMVQFLEIYAFSNKSDKAVIISTNGTDIPFIKMPSNAQNSGFEPGQDTASFVSADQGMAAVPSDKPYSIIAFFSMPYTDKLEIAQPFGIDAPSVLLLFPEGMKVQSNQLTSEGTQTFQNVNYQEFSSSGFKAGDTLNFTISGLPTAASASTTNSAQSPLIGAGILGLVLIGAGGWLYFRDRNKEEDEQDEREFESSDEVMDAILALDDLHRAGKIADNAYHKRRDELKKMLKELA